MTASAGSDAVRTAGAPRGARAAGAAALALIAVSIIVLAALMALGPSAAVPAIGPGAPLWSLSAGPPEVVSVTLARVGLLTGAAGVTTGLIAIRHGWRPRARLLLGAGAAAAAVYVFLPPAGSIDVLNYAIYGRIASLHHNPYLMRPSELYRSADPVGLFAPSNWRTLPTVYGPVATVFQWAAAQFGGASMARIVFFIRLFNALAYVATAAALARLSGPGTSRQARACLLWAVNPLMLFWLVGSGHVDVLLAALVAAALVTARGSGLAAGVLTGVLAGAATAIKTPFALAAAGLAWAARRSPRMLAAGLAGAAIVLVPAFLVPGVLNTAVLSRRLSVSAGFIYPVPALIATRPALFGAAVLVATLALAALLLWRLPAGHPSLPAVRPVMALALAWLAVFPVQAPWYDALIFSLLALMPGSRLDYLLIARCLLLSEMLLPGARPNSGAVSIAVARLSHAGLLLLILVLAAACLLRGWGDTPPGGARHASPANRSREPGAGWPEPARVTGPTPGPPVGSTAERGPR